MTPHETVRLIPALAETHAPLPSLLIATAEPPRSGESVVLDARGMCLAESRRDGDWFCWEYTVPGKARLEREVQS